MTHDFATYKKCVDAIEATPHKISDLNIKIKGIRPESPFRERAAKALGISKKTKLQEDCEELEQELNAIEKGLSEANELRWQYLDILNVAHTENADHYLIYDFRSKNIPGGKEPKPFLQDLKDTVNTCTAQLKELRQELGRKNPSK